MSKQATLSTVIDSELKKILVSHCKKRGLKIQSVVQAALRELIEDQIDLEIYHDRKNEKEVSLNSVLKKLQKKPKNSNKKTL